MPTLEGVKKQEDSKACLGYRVGIFKTKTQTNKQQTKPQKTKNKPTKQKHQPNNNKTMKA